MVSLRKSDVPAVLLALEVAVLDATELETLLELTELDICDEATLDRLLELDVIVVKLMT